MAKTLITTDFETIPDLSLAEYLTGYKDPEDPDTEDMAMDTPRRVEALKAYAKERFGNEDAMLPPGLNQIVAAGIHLADIRFTDNIGEWYETKHLSSTAESEFKIVTDMVGWFEKLLPQIVTFNGRSFDIPLLSLRAMHHGVSMKFWYDNRGDKWNNYTSRYSPDYHFDVLDFISSQGAAPRMKLREFMAILRLPDKAYSGSDVLCLWSEGKLDIIRDYTELDCLNTFLCFVHCQFLRGSISREGRDTSIRSVVVFLQKHLDNQNLVNFLTEWTNLDPFIKAEAA